MIDAFGIYDNLTGFEQPGKCFWCGCDVKGIRRYCCTEHKKEYHRHYYWFAAAEWCLQRYNYTCADCGFHSPKAKRLRAHHIEPLNGEARNRSVKNVPENLVCLCPSCHAKRHAWLDAEKKGDKAPAHVIKTQTEYEKAISNGQLALEGF